MKKKFIICLLIAFTLSVIFVFLFYNPKGEPPSNGESPSNEKGNLLCRMNIRTYLKNLDLDLIECILPGKLETRVQDGFAKPTILFIIDDPLQSSDQSRKNYSNFLDNDNLLLCISEDWLDKAHPKLQLWPIGLPSKTVQNKNLVKILLERMSTPIEGKGIMSNAHFKTYNTPTSSFRDDRKDMIRALKDQNIVDFWNHRPSIADTFYQTQKYAYNLCPEGNGLDTHRFYETFALGVHPVIRRGPLTGLHEHFETTKVVERWEDVTRLQTERPILKVNLEKLTIGYWLYKCLRSRCKIVTFCTGNLCEEWRSLVTIIRKRDLFDLLVVFPLDDEALEYCQNEGVVFRTDLVCNNLPGTASCKKNYKNIMKAKLYAIQVMLSENYFVLYFERNIAFVQNPIVYIFNLYPKDIYFQPHTSHVSKRTIQCAGFIFMIPNRKCIELIGRSVKRIEKSMHNMCDQDVINHILKNKNIEKLDYGILPPNI